MRLLLVHWDDREQQALAEELRTWGHEVIAGFTTVGALYDSRPEGVVISLRRLPDHGKQTARTLRRHENGHSIPLLFADGMPDRVADLMEEFHRARFVSWDELESALADYDSTTEELARPTIPTRLT